MPSVDTIMLDTANYLQTLNQSITGVTWAPQVAAYPTVIDTPNCPVVLSWPADGQFYIKGGAARQLLRTWRVVCFLEPVAQNDTPSNAVDAMMLMQRMINAYISVANVAQANPPPYQLTIESGPDQQHSDGGLTAGLLFRGVPFHGWELRVTVRALY